MIAFTKLIRAMLGGHLMEGCLIDTTCEVVLTRLTGWALNREQDEGAGISQPCIRECVDSECVRE